MPSDHQRVVLDQHQLIFERMLAIASSQNGGRALRDGRQYVVAVDVDTKDAMDVVDTDGVMLGFGGLRLRLRLRAVEQ